ncbi:MAG: hypothetical protein MR488_04845 [Lachnospiraceae bacterium]|nr:hypothetical protein [Lachnospiraceae bacterium]
MKRLIRAIRKAVENMAVIYAALIIKGKKTIDDVPAVIREKVRQILIDLDLPELAGEDQTETGSTEAQ